MIRNPIQKVTNKLQYRAIGIVNGIYKPHQNDQLNKGTLTDSQGNKFETVILGKALSLIKKYINLDKSYFWIVYPKNKNTQNLYFQIAGIWDPYQLNDIGNKDSKKDSLELLEELNLADNYFSVRGELVYVNTQKKEIVIKIVNSSKPIKLKRNNFKLVLEGEISLEILNNFVSLEVKRDGNSLKMVSYEIIEKNNSKKNNY